MASSSQNRNKQTKGVKIGDVVDPIIISSDEEDEIRYASHVYGFQWHWKKKVTSAMENLKKKQTLHLPAWVVTTLLKRKAQIWVRSADRKRCYKCTMKNPGRGASVRYIGDGWYKYLMDHKPKVGDTLFFDVTPPNNLDVKLVRRPRKLGKSNRGRS